MPGLFPVKVSNSNFNCCSMVMFILFILAGSFLGLSGGRLIILEERVPRKCCVSGKALLT